MQKFYGMAIRSNLSNVYAMKKTIYAILFHFTNTNDPLERYKFCPRETNSWCKVLVQGPNGLQTPQHNPSLDKESISTHF